MKFKILTNCQLLDNIYREISPVNLKNVEAKFPSRGNTKQGVQNCCQRTLRMLLARRQVAQTGLVRKLEEVATPRLPSFFDSARIRPEPPRTHCKSRGHCR